MMRFTKRQALVLLGANPQPTPYAVVQAETRKLYIEKNGDALLEAIESVQ